MAPEMVVPYIQNLALRNIADLLTILQWNESHGIRFFRITSCIFPHMGNGKTISLFPEEGYFKGDIEFAKDELEKVGEYVKLHGHRVTFHSQPYVQLGSPTPSVLENSIFDIKMHYKTYQLMGLEPGPYHCLIMHGGGVYGDKKVTLERIEENARKLLSPDELRMLVFENDEWHYTPRDLLPLCERLGVAFCFDAFHNRVSRERIPVTRKLLKRIIATWGTYRPKFHLSEQAKGERRGTHSDIVGHLPRWMCEEVPADGWDIMLECKLKEQSILALMERGEA
jgi:UV DNA damage endonuclease